MFELLTKFLLFTTLLVGSYLTHECGDWTPFKDEKCFKAFDKAVDESTAEEVCKQNTNESVLAVIKTSEEQQLIEKYLKTIKIADNVWIDVKKTNNVFKYSDGKDVEYNNWAKDRPLKNSNESNCVVISVDELIFGKWIDDSCQKKNAVLCEKKQSWTVERFQNILFETRRMLKELQKTSDSQNEMIEQLKKGTNNSIPIGFIYAQLSGQSDPKTLWPNTEWENISVKYSGLFFRAEGEQSSTFGTIQEQQSHSFQIYNDYCDGNSTFEEWKTLTDKPFEKYIFTGSLGKSIGINIKHNNEEIRPRNQAIRIWQRIK